MLTIISILIFTFILFLILLFGKRYYDGIGLTKIEEEEEEEDDETSGDFYNITDRNSYFSDEVIDCEETIASSDTCVTIGQDLVTILQYPMNGGKACSEKICKGVDVYNCRARGKEREVFIQRRSDNKFLNINFKPCLDYIAGRNCNMGYFSSDSTQCPDNEYTCKWPSGIKPAIHPNNWSEDDLSAWDVVLNWEDYNVTGNATKWKLKILPIDTSSETFDERRDSFQLYMTMHIPEWSFGPHTFYLRNENTDELSCGANTCEYKVRYNEPELLVFIQRLQKILETGISDFDNLPLTDDEIEFTKGRLNDKQNEADANKFYFKSHNSEGSEGVNLICGEDNTQTIVYEPKFDCTCKDNENCLSEEVERRENDQICPVEQKECGEDYKKCISYDDFFSYHGNNLTDYSFGKCVPKTQFMDKISETNTDGNLKWSSEFTDIVTRKCDQIIECDEGMESSFIFNESDEQKQQGYMIKQFMDKNYPDDDFGDLPVNTKGPVYEIVRKFQDDEMKTITYSQACTIKTE
jgi:hypothetical protein